jgi:MFS family permease
LTGVLLGLYLGQADLGAGALGLVVGAGLSGLALGTLIVAYLGDALGRRRTLLAATLLSAGGLFAVAAAESLLPLVVGSFLGMVNGMGRDRGPAQALEQALLADQVAAAGRTRAFVRYTLAQDLAGAFGALAAALPSVLAAQAGQPVVEATRWVFGGAALLSLVPALIYAGLPADPRPDPGLRTSGLLRRTQRPETRRRVRGLASLFALDSLGGGFLAGSILTFWFFRRFGLEGDVLGPVFFAERALNAGSYLLAAPLARRIGLIRTMVFTHLPSSLLLVALPFVPTAGLAVALFLIRAALVQMDVPARQSYVAAVAEPAERTYVLGVTGVVRNVGWAAGPPLSGFAMTAWGLGAPLVIGAALKVVYDLALFASFRRVLPPEEVG